MEQIEQGSRKYGYSIFLKNHCCPNETMPKKQVKAKFKYYSLNSFFDLSKPIGVAFFSTAYIQHTSVL